MDFFSLLKNYFNNLITTINGEPSSQQRDVQKIDPSSAASTDPIAPIAPVKPIPPKTPVEPVGSPQPQASSEDNDPTTTTTTSSSSSTTVTKEATTAPTNQDKGATDPANANPNSVATVVAATTTETAQAMAKADAASTLEANAYQNSIATTNVESTTVATNAIDGEVIAHAPSTEATTTTAQTVAKVETASALQGTTSEELTSRVEPSPTVDDIEDKAHTTHTIGEASLAAQDSDSATSDSDSSSSSFSSSSSLQEKQDTEQQVTAHADTNVDAKAESAEPIQDAIEDNAAELDQEDINARAAELAAAAQAKAEAAAAEEARQQVLQAHPELQLSAQEQQDFAAVHRDRLSLDLIRTYLSEQLLALLGVKCVAQLLQEEEAKAGMSLGLILCDNLDPRYVELIAAQLYQLKLNPHLGMDLSLLESTGLGSIGGRGSEGYDGDDADSSLEADGAGAGAVNAATADAADATTLTLWDKLNLTITRKTLLELYDETNLPAYPWLVPDEQNATYWRNNKKAGQYNLCAITSGETEDTLGNIRTRITSDTLKSTLAQHDVLPQLLALLNLLTKRGAGAGTAMAGTGVEAGDTDAGTAIDAGASAEANTHAAALANCKIDAERLQHDPRLGDLSVVLSQLIERFSLRPLTLCEFLAEVIIRYTFFAQGLLEAMGQAMCVLHYPSDSWLFTNVASSRSKKGGTALSATGCKRVLEKMQKDRPSLLDSATTGLSVDDFTFEQLLDNFKNLMGLGIDKDATGAATEGQSKQGAGAAAKASAKTGAAKADAEAADVGADTQDGEGSEGEVEAEPHLSAWESALCKHYLLSLSGSQAMREQSFVELCLVEWNARLERFFSATAQRTKLTLSERTLNMFNKRLTADEALSDAELEVIKLADTAAKALSLDERHQLNELYNQRRAIFSQESAISKEWEKLIYFQSSYNEPDFLFALSSVMLNLYHGSQPTNARLAKVELRLDVNNQDLLEINYYVLSYFSLRYGSFLTQLSTALKQRLEIKINGNMETDAPNPVLQFPAYFAYKQAKQQASPSRGHGVRSSKALKPCLEGKDKNTILKFTLTPYYQNQRSLLRTKDTSVALKPGRHFKLTWQLKPSSLSYHFASDLEALLAAQTVQQGAFEHNTFAAQGTLQALNLADCSTFGDQQGGEFVSFFKRRLASLEVSENSDNEDMHVAEEQEEQEGREESYDPCDLSSAYQLKLQALVADFAAQEHFPEAYHATVQAQLQDMAQGYQHFAESYLLVLSSIKDGSFNLTRCQELSLAHTKLQYCLINCALCTEPSLVRDYASLGQQVRDLLFIVLRVGMAYPLSQPSSDIYRYALATPFTVESLRSFAAKCERVQNLIFNIFTTPLSFNDRDVFLNSWKQDLAYYDAPEICLSFNFNAATKGAIASHDLASSSLSSFMPANQSAVLLANQSLGGYTLYESESKLQQDLGFTRKSNPLGRALKRGRKSASAPISTHNGEGGGGGSSGVGGIGAVNEASNLYLNAIVEQVRTYITLQPYPLNQCTVVLSRCSLPYFAHELYLKFKQELCPQFPDLQLNLLLLCDGIVQAQKLYQVFNAGSQWQQELPTTVASATASAASNSSSLLPPLRVTILLEQQGNELKNGTLSDYVENISLHQGLDNALALEAESGLAPDSSLVAEHEADLRRFGHIGLIVHVFDAAAQFQFTGQLYAVPVVQDEVNYQPTLLNFSQRYSATQLSRFMVCPTLPLSKIQYLHSLYYVREQDISPFITAHESLAQAVTARVASANTESAESATSQNMPVSIATPLYERILRSDSGDEDLHELIQEIHRSCDVVCYVDDLLTHRALQQQQLEVIYQQKLHNHALNFMVATKSAALMANNFLNDLTKSLGLYDEQQRLRCLEALRRDAIDLSGRLLMRAKLKRIYSYELMGVVLSHYLAHEMMQQLCLQYSGQLSNTYETFICLDDYRALFQARNSSRNQQFADLLGLQVIRYPESTENSIDSDKGSTARASASAHNHRYLLHLMVLESKFLQQENSAAARESLHQAAFTTNLLYRALQDQGDATSLDRATWLSRLANLWRENVDSTNIANGRMQNTLGNDELSQIQQLIQEGKVDILLHGVSLVFACKADSATSRECQVILKPTMAQASSEDDFPILQIKLSHDALMRVLHKFSLNQGQGQAKALPELQQHFADEVKLIGDYLAHDSRIYLQPQVLRSTQDKFAQEALAALDVPEFLQQQQQQLQQPQLPPQPLLPQTPLSPSPSNTTTSVEASDTTKSNESTEPTEPTESTATVEPTQSNPTKAQVFASATTQALPATKTPPATPTTATIVDTPVISTPTGSTITTIKAQTTVVKMMSGATELEQLQARLPQTFAQLERSAHDADLHSTKRQAWLENTLNAFTTFCQRDLRSRPLIIASHLTPNGAVLLIDGRSLDYNELNKKTTQNSLQTRCAVTITALHPRSGQIEVNLAAPDRAMVYYRDLMQQRSFGYEHYECYQAATNEAPSRSQDCLGFNAKFVLGMRESDDQPVYFDLREDDPHLLIAGGTGSGKSVLIKLLLTDMVLSNTQQELRLILVDPKMGNELQVFSELPQVMGLSELRQLLPKALGRSGGYPFGLNSRGTYDHWSLGLDLSLEDEEESTAAATADLALDASHKIITNESDCVMALQILEQLTTVRNQQFAKLVAHLKSLGKSSTIVKLDEYNALAPQYDFPRLPRLFFVMDEFADWALDDAFKEGQESLRKIAQIGRSAGIHLILITQRPDRKVIEGAIHNNFGSRIALKMNSIYDSKTILENKDYNASNLQGNGHMICKLKNVGGDGYCSAQAGFISDLAALLDALKRDYAAQTAKS